MKQIAQLMYLQISIHAPAKGATVNLSSRQVFSVISIHAPAKGATVSYLESDTYHNISIHAPAKGATQRVYLHVTLNIFQSTLPRRERLSKEFIYM